LGQLELMLSVQATTIVSIKQLILEEHLVLGTRQVVNIKTEKLTSLPKRHSLYQPPRMPSVASHKRYHIHAWLLCNWPVIPC